MKPMLAGKVDLAKLKYPAWISPKYDGIRALGYDCALVSRNLKNIPNRHCQEMFAQYQVFDGELICGEPTAKDCYRQTDSAVMSKDGKPDVKYYVFDFYHDSLTIEKFSDRYGYLITKTTVARDPNVVLVPQVLVHNEAELLAQEEKWLAEGYEGAMVRAIDGRYKEGRSTTKEGYLLKLKRFTDAEAEIIGFEELHSNQNEAKKDALGHTERSMHQANMIPMGVLGALVVRDCESGVEFNIGTGLNAADRDYIWKNREFVRGQVVKYKSFAIGVKDKPRFPVFLGFRTLGT